MKVFEMRKYLKEYYKKCGWNTDKVKIMPDNQVMAIYFRCQRQGWPMPKPKVKSNGQIKGQLCLFS